MLATLRTFSLGAQSVEHFRFVEDPSPAHDEVRDPTQLREPPDGGASDIHAPRELSTIEQITTSQSDASALSLTS
jgi:hypothetical protein